MTFSLNKLPGLLLLISVFGFMNPIFAIDNGLLRTPPMGWNSWNIFHENINENQIKQIADIMVSSGMKDAGYIYLNLDDNWMATSRDGSGNLRADPTRFPSGMKSLGDYIHNKGLKFGIYGDRGLRTCHHFYSGLVGSGSGSYGNESRDAITFASWGVDYLKYDNCDPAPGSNQQRDFEKMRDALANSGRSIAYSVCAWEFKSWMPNTGNLWRTTGDISDKWTAEPGFFRGIINIIDENANLAQHAKPGAWNDPDMLQIGNGGSSTEEYRTQMSMWSIMAAPLFAGNDIRTMSQATKDILLNREVIAVNQDSAGIQGRRIRAANGLEIWTKPLGSANSPTKAVALLNRNATRQDITVNFSDIGYSTSDLLTVRDLWAKVDRGRFSGSYTMSVPSHGTGMLRVTKKMPSLDTVPGRVEAENYISMRGIEAGSDDQGNIHVGYVNNGDWTRYMIQALEENTYVVRAKLATAADANSTITIKSVKDGHTLGILTVNATMSEGWKDWYVDSTEIVLDYGEQELLFEFSGSSEYLFDVDWFEFTVKQSPMLRLPSHFQTSDFNITQRKVPGGLALFVQSPSGARSTLQIMNTQGKIVFEQIVQDRANIHLTSSNELPKGLYYLVLNFNGVRCKQMTILLH